MSKYIIYADEAWTHNSQPLNRYHNFFGGIFGEEKYIDRLVSELQKIKKLHNKPNAEIKWSNLKNDNIILYKAIVDCLSNHILSGRIRYRQMFTDRSFHYVGDKTGSNLDIQFKQYYQFLKHSFGIQYLSALESGKKHEVVLRLDNHSSQNHKNALNELVQSLPNIINRHDVEFKVTYINSSKYICLQACDLIMGAAGYHGNKIHKRRENGKKRMTKTQKLRHEMAEYIYNSLRKINNISRGAKAFNWFETTGRDGDKLNILQHRLRIWKFIPHPYKKNKGWENDHLDKQGLFIKDDFEDRIIDK